MSCSPGVRDPNGILWQMSADNLGRITLASTGIVPAFFEDPVLLSTNRNVSWKFAADQFGRLTWTSFNYKPPTIRLEMNYFTTQSPNGTFWKVQISDSGVLTQTSSASMIPDNIPYIPDVTMSTWPLSIGVFCARCGNASVHVSADLSCWCCSCNSFVPDEETNLLVILDE